MNFFSQSVWAVLGTSVLSAALTFALVKVSQQIQKRRQPGAVLKVPELGGIAIFISFWAGFFMLFPMLLFNSSQWSIFIASGVILLTGMLDDRFVLKPYQKSLGILLAANIIYFSAGIEFSSALLPEIHPEVFEVISYCLTIAWIYFVSNAINLLDGMDGLASSISLTSLLTLAITTYFFSLSIRMALLLMLILLAAAILGFLPFNWHPARIYLGDTGALFIGFMYATLTVSNLKNATFFSLFVPIILYMVPLFDTSYAIFRRFMSGQSIVSRDEDHVHHRLLRIGLSETQVVLLMIGIALVFSGLAILSHLFPTSRNYILVIMLVMVAVMFFAMYQLSDRSKKD